MLICLYSSYMQLKSNFILVGLRKNQHGDVITKEHKIPFGGLFKYISNPLQLTEIIIYIMLSVILWQASTFHYITIWVIINQVQRITMYFFLVLIKAKNTNNLFLVGMCNSVP